MRKPFRVHPRVREWAERLAFLVAFLFICAIIIISTH